jgi:hypothetical protein
MFLRVDRKLVQRVVGDWSRWSASATTQSHANPVSCGLWKIIDVVAANRMSPSHSRKGAAHVALPRSPHSGPAAEDLVDHDELRKHPTLAVARIDQSKLALLGTILS